MTTGVGLGAGVLVLFAAAAFACTQRVGTFTVCEPPSTVYSSATCAKVTGTTQSGKVGGTNGVSSGNTFSGRATNFKSKLYQVTFRDAGSTQDCHRPLTNAATHSLADIATGATKFAGPNFYKTFVVPTQTTTGAARVCTQDVPDVVTGQVIDLTVL
ncbi:MAG: hypothetical protein ACRD0N_09060 [Acidimicrobiales bacterium]